MANETFETLVERYGNMKAEADSYKKQIDDDNKRIKEHMSQHELSEYTAGGYTVKYSVSVSENFDEEKLLERVKQISGSLVIKTKEYVDMEALENAIYNGRISAADIADCKVTKETPRLTISKVKDETPKTRTRRKKSEE